MSRIGCKNPTYFCLYQQCESLVLGVYNMPIVSKDCTVNTKIHTLTLTLIRLWNECSCEICWNADKIPAKAKDEMRWGCITRTFMFTIMIVMSNILSESKKQKCSIDEKKRWTKTKDEETERNYQKKKEKRIECVWKKKKKKNRSVDLAVESSEPKRLHSIGHVINTLQTHPCIQIPTLKWKEKTTTT